MAKRRFVRPFAMMLVCLFFAATPASASDVYLANCPTPVCASAGACPGALFWDFSSALTTEQKSMTVYPTYIESCSGAQAYVWDELPPPVPVQQSAYVGSEGRPWASAALTGSCVIATMASGFWGRPGQGINGMLFGGSVFVYKGGLDSVSEIDIVVPVAGDGLTPSPCHQWGAVGAAAPYDLHVGAFGLMTQ